MVHSCPIVVAISSCLLPQPAVCCWQANLISIMNEAKQNREGEVEWVEEKNKNGEGGGRQPAEFLFSLNVLNLCCHLWRQWQTVEINAPHLTPYIVVTAPCPHIGGHVAQIHILKFTPHFSAAPLSLFCCSSTSHSLLWFLLSRAGLINFYIRYTSLKILHCFVPPVCVCVCAGYFRLAKWLSCTNVAQVGRKDSHLILVSMRYFFVPLCFALCLMACKWSIAWA